MTNKRYAQEFVRKLQTFHLLEDLSSNAGAEVRTEVDRANEQPQLFCLLESFARNMVAILSTNLKLDLKKPKEKNVQIAIDGQDERARAKWERLTGFMLNIDDVQRGKGIGPSLINLLVHADFVQPVPPASQSHTNSTTPFELTADGFRFVLLDTPTQVHTMLRKYIERTVHE